MQTSTTTIFIQTNSRSDDSLPTVYLVLAELIDGRTADGEYFIVLAAYRDEAAAERRAEAERAGGKWGHFDPKAEHSEYGWVVRVESVELSA